VLNGILDGKKLRNMSGQEGNTENNFTEVKVTVQAGLNWLSVENQWQTPASVVMDFVFL
jgi:hypothetical protein